MNKLVLALIGALSLVGYAHADTCTAGVSVTNASTQVLAASDVQGGRHFLMLQNIGAQGVYCAIGETATTSTGFLLQTGGSVLLEGSTGPSGVVKAVPSGAVNCITASSTTTVSVCDY